MKTAAHKTYSLGYIAAINPFPDDLPVKKDLPLSAPISMESCKRTDIARVYAPGQLA